MSVEMGVESSSGRYFAFCSHVLRKEYLNWGSGGGGWGWTAANEMRDKVSMQEDRFNQVSCPSSRFASY